jgi:hypothetical protein
MRARVVACLLQLATVDLTVRRYDTDGRRSDEHRAARKPAPIARRKLIVVGGPSDRTAIADTALRSRKRKDHRTVERALPGRDKGAACVQGAFLAE